MKNIRKRLPVMKLEEDARLGRKGFRPVIEVLIFLAVFYATNVIQSVPLTVIMLVMLFCSPSFSELIERIANEPYDVTELPAYVEEMTAELTDSLMLPSLFLTVATFVAVFIYCRFIEKRPLRSLGFRKGQILAEYGVGLLIGTGLFSLAVGLCALTGTLRVSLVATGVLWLVPIYFVGFVIQGMSEEVLCRGYFLVSVSRRGKMSVAILLNSLLFAALHLLNPGVTPLAILNLVLFGVFASVYFLKRGNIWGIGAIHTAWNFVQGNLFGISVSGMSGTPSILTSEIKEGFLPELLNGGAFGLEGGLAVTVVLLAATAVMLFVPAKRSEISETGLPSADAPAAETPDEEPSDDGSATQLD